MKRNSIKFKIPFFISVFALICVLVTGIIFQYTFRYKLEDSIENKNMIISEMASNELELYLRNATETAVTAANFSTQSDGNLKKIEEEIFRMYDNFQYFDLIFFMNNQAKMVFSKPPNNKVQNRIYTDRNYYWQIIENKKSYTLSPLLVSSVLKKLHFIIAAPVRNDSDEVIGLIGAGIPLRNIKAILNDLEERFDGRIWIADESGNIVIHSDFTKENVLVSIDELGIEVLDDKSTIQDVLWSKEKQNIRYKINTNEYYGAVTFVEGADWLVVVEQNKKKINSEIYESMNQLALIQVVVLFFALSIGLIMASWLTKPIEELVNQVRLLPQYLKNNEDIVIEPLYNESDEIFELSEAFIIMRNQLKENMEEIEISCKRENRIQQYLNNILASVHNGIIVADANCNITIINEQAKQITKIQEGFEVPNNINDLFEILGLHVSEVLKDVISSETYYSEVETNLKPFIGKNIIISYSCSPVKDKNRNNLGIIFQFRDITRIKAIEKEIKREDRINTMGELSASIIHDIGNPLAGMSNLIEVIKDESMLESSKNRALELLSDEVNDLNILVINFLDFVRSGDVEKKSMDLLKLINDCTSLFNNDIKKRKIKVIEQFTDVPLKANIRGRSIKQAIINIYKNAIQAVEDNGIIKLVLIEHDQTIEFSISDNGCGMNEEEKTKLFNPFFTTKLDGTGLGMAIAYNALKENDCQLLVESDLNKGSKFTIIFQKE